MTLLLVSATVHNRLRATVVRVRLLCLGESFQTVSFLDVSEDVLMSFCVAAWHFVTFDVFQQECVCTTVVRLKLSCLWVKPPKRVFLDVSEDVVMSFCAAGVALCYI